MIGSTPAEALPVLAKLRKEGIAFTVDLLGEATVSEVESEEYARRYLEILEVLAEEQHRWPDNPALDEGPDGLLPKVNVSIKVSSLYSQMDALAYEDSIEALKRRLRPLMLRARETGAFVNLDLEQFSFRDLTLDLFTQLCDEPELAGYPHFGVVVQAYLKDATRDAERLIRWAKKRRTPFTVRLVKGAYWDYETILARQKGWPSPVFTRKEDSDASFEQISRMLIDAWPNVWAAFGSHNVRSIAYAVAYARARAPRQGHRAPEPLRHGRAHSHGLHQEGAAPAGLRPGRRAAARHGLPRAASAGEHLEPGLHAPELRRGRLGGEPAPPPPPRPGR
jgi:RHH-type proline utilization regulon transcriptional repressor/proline dehydrogenase/delta 1-pyrroline-5-carboxylate dehydrogenase